MNENQIAEILRSCEVTENIFQGIYPIDSIPNKIAERNSGIVANTGPSWTSGYHWISAFRPFEGPTIFFDSYGSPPPPALLGYLGKNYIYNDIKLQGPFSSVCGQYCIYFMYCMAMGKSLRYTANSLDHNDKGLNDFLVNNAVENIFHVNLQVYDKPYISSQISKALFSYS